MFPWKKILYLLTAGLAGSLMAVQGTLNALAGKITGLLPTTLAVHILGTATAGLLLLVFPTADLLKKIPSVPLYAWLGGPIGVFIIYGVAVTIPRLGVGVTTTGIIFFQLLTAYFIDHFGLLGREHLPFTWLKLIGIILMVGGSYLLLKK